MLLTHIIITIVINLIIVLLTLAILNQTNISILVLKHQTILLLLIHIRLLILSILQQIDLKRVILTFLILLDNLRQLLFHFSLLTLFENHRIFIFLLSNVLLLIDHWLLFLTSNSIVDCFVRIRVIDFAWFLVNFVDPTFIDSRTHIAISYFHISVGICFLLNWTFINSTDLLNIAVLSIIIISQTHLNIKRWNIIFILFSELAKELFFLLHLPLYFIVKLIIIWQIVLLFSFTVRHSVDTFIDHLINTGIYDLDSTVICLLLMIWS